jgi:hypothetical protein
MFNSSGTSADAASGNATVSVSVWPGRAVVKSTLASAIASGRRLKLPVIAVRALRVDRRFRHLLDRRRCDLELADPCRHFHGRREPEFLVVARQCHIDRRRL